MRGQRIPEKPSLSSLQKVSLKALAADNNVWMGMRCGKGHIVLFSLEKSGQSGCHLGSIFSCSSMKLGECVCVFYRPRRLLATTISEIHMAPSV